jgi:Tfp pilus assembly protein PilF
MLPRAQATAAEKEASSSSSSREVSGGRSVESESERERQRERGRERESERASERTLRQAHAMLRKALAIAPTHPDVLSACARLCWQRGRVMEAADLLRAAALAEPRVLRGDWARQAYAAGIASHMQLYADTYVEL